MQKFRIVGTNMTGAGNTNLEIAVSYIALLPATTDYPKH